MAIAAGIARIGQQISTALLRAIMRISYGPLRLKLLRALGYTEATALAAIAANPRAPQAAAEAADDVAGFISARWNQVATIKQNMEGNWPDRGIPNTYAVNIYNNSAQSMVKYDPWGKIMSRIDFFSRSDDTHHPFPHFHTTFWWPKGEPKWDPRVFPGLPKNW